MILILTPEEKKDLGNLFAILLLKRLDLSSKWQADILGSELREIKE